MPKQISADIISKDLIKRGEDLIKVFVKLQEEFEKVANTAIQGQKAFEGQTRSQKDLTDKGKQLTVLQQEQIALDNKIAKTKAHLTEEYQKQNREFLKAKEAEKQLQEQQKKSLGIQNRFIGGIKQSITTIAAWAAGIGIGLSALKKLGQSIINSSDLMQDKWAVAMEVASTTWDRFTKALSGGGLGGFFKNFGNMVKEAKEFAEAMDKSEDRSRALAIAESEMNIRKQANLKILRNQTATLEQHLQAGQAIIDDEDKLAKLRVDIAKQRKDDLLASYKSLGITEKMIENQLYDYELNSKKIDAADKYNAAINTVFKAESSQFSIIIKQTDSYKEAVATIQAYNKDDIAFAQERAKYNMLNKEQMDEFAKAKIEYNNAQASFDENTQRTASRLSGYLAESNKQLEKKLELTKEINQEEFKPTGQIKGGLLTPIGTPDFSASKDAEQAYLDESLNKYVNYLKTKGQKTQEEIDLEAEMYAQAVEDLQGMTLDTLNQGFDLRGQYIQKDIDDLNKRRDAEIEAAEQAGESTIRIKNRYKKEEDKLRQKAAINDKLGKIFNAGTSIAEGIIKYSSNPITAPLLPWFIALSAAQLGMIIAEPIPKFFGGVKNKQKGGLSMVGDSKTGGSQTEFVQLPNGEGFIATKPTLLDLPAGSSVFTENSPETKVALNQFNDKGIINEIRKMSDIMAVAYEITARGIIRTNLNNRTRTTYIH